MILERILKGLRKVLSKTWQAIRSFFTFKGFLKGFAGLLLVLFVGTFAYLWYISKYPNIPAYSEITSYRFLNPSDEKECVNPDPVNANPDDPANDIMIPSYQGWCNEQRQHYYRTPQGTDFFGLQYDWITALEKPVGKEPLVTREYMERLGYIYDPAKKPNANNPADLPVGLTWHYDKDSGAKILDVSCAACHSAQITYQGTSLVIDGGQGGHALPSLEPTQFIANSVVSLLVTYINPLKFARFSRKVLQDVPEEEYSAEKRKLRAATWASIKSALHYASNNFFLYPTVEGYGRTDGLGRIANTVYGDYISDENYKTADAPVNYPHVWDIWAFDWVQWMGSVRQAMARNVNEALGTRAQINLTHANGLYDNSVMMGELHCIETTLQHLKPPTWPEDLFGKVDRSLAKQGEKIFSETCAKCHGPFRREAVDGKIDYEATAKNHQCVTCHGPLMTGSDGQLLDLLNRKKHPQVQVARETWLGDTPDTEIHQQWRRGGYWEMIHIPLAHIGTDPTSAENMINYKYDISSLVEQVKQKRSEGSILRLPDPASIPDPSQTGFAEGLSYIGGEVRYKQYREWGLMQPDGYTPKPDEVRTVADLDGFGEQDNPVAWRAYRPRPLEGIWATAPFLHNGSVPSIYQMLLPAEERDQVFYLGRKEYDPEKLGIKVDEFKGAFKFDTTVKGNSNMGHEFNDGLCGDGVIGYQVEDRPGYCRQFTEQERLAILEYLKIHSDGARPNPGSAPNCGLVNWPEKS
ncbi:MAG: di-heme-cytochrome C peroxidase [Pseudomonadota bacterium]